jgi:hypothetical protein
VSAIAIICFHNVAHLAVDVRPAQSDAEKMFTAPHLPLALACLGPEEAATTVGSSLSRMFSSFDELIQGVERRSCLADLAATLPETTFLTGWSTRRRRAEAYLLRSGGNGVSSLVQIKSTSYTPAIPQWSAAAALQRAKTDGIRAHMLDVMAQQADHPGVGDSYQLTTVSEAQITSRILRRWPPPSALAS